MRRVIEVDRERQRAVDRRWETARLETELAAERAELAVLAAELAEVRRQIMALDGALSSPEAV